MKRKLNLRFRLWVFADESPFLGIGPIELLERIELHGSISKAAEDMQMSYRKAWKIVQNMNELSDTPLVTTKLGGVKGGGAEVTPKGKEIVKKYHLLEKETERFLKEKTQEIGL